jgi:hypothetical protein
LWYATYDGTDDELEGAGAEVAGAPVAGVEVAGAPVMGAEVAGAEVAGVADPEEEADGHTLLISAGHFT